MAHCMHCKFHWLVCFQFLYKIHNRYCDLFIIILLQIFRYIKECVISYGFIMTVPFGPAFLVDFLIMWLSFIGSEVNTALHQQHGDHSHWRFYPSLHLPRYLYSRATDLQCSFSWVVCQSYFLPLKVYGSNRKHFIGSLSIFGSVFSRFSAKKTMIYNTKFDSRTKHDFLIPVSRTCLQDVD